MSSRYFEVRMIRLSGISAVVGAEYAVWLAEDRADRRQNKVFCRGLSNIQVYVVVVTTTKYIRAFTTAY